MNWYSVFSVRSVMGVALVMAGLAHAADVKLSETTELQAGGDLTYTFASGDTFVVDAAFAPTSFKPICLGDFTMKVEGTGSVAATTQLDFSVVTGALTLSGLGTTEPSLPKQAATATGTVAATASEEPAPAAASTESASEPATEESAPALVAEDTATLTFAPVLLTAEVSTEGFPKSTLTANDTWANVKAGAVDAEGAETVPVLTISEATATWSTGSWSSGSAPTSGDVVIAATMDATLTIDSAVSLSNLTFEVTDGNTLTLALGTGGSLAVTTATTVSSGKVIVQGGTYGAVSIADAATLLFAQDGMFTSIAEGGTVGLTTAGSLTLSYGGTAVETNSSKLLLRTGTFRKEGSGNVTLQAYNVSDAENQSIEVAGGTLTFFEQGGLQGNATMNRDRHIFKMLSVAQGCTFKEYAKWGVHFAVREALVGEGTISTDTGSQAGLRKFFISGEAKDFTGTIDFEKWTSLVFESTSSGVFGGSITLKQSGRSDVQLVVERAAGLSVGGSVTLGSGVGLDLSAGGGLSVGGSFTLSGPVPVTLPATPADGFALVTLTGEGAKADTATAEKFASVPSGYVVVAEEASYVLRKVTLPGVNPSAPDAGDEQAYSTEAAAALTAAAEEARLAEVSQVLLQTKGAAAAVPTVTEVNNVLGCFDGVVEADAEAQTLTIRYEFGVADIAADDSVTPWNGKWQVVAKVEGPTGAAFAEGVTVAAYEVGEDGIIAADATPLATTTIAAGTPVNSVVLRGLVLEGLGTHGVRVRVKATK